MKLPALPEPDVYHDNHPFGGGPESYSDDAMRAYGELCARLERERCAALCDATATKTPNLRLANENMRATFKGCALGLAAAIRSETP